MVSHQIKVSQNFVCCSDQSKIPTLSVWSLSKYWTANSCKLNHQELAQITFSLYIFSLQWLLCFSLQFYLSLPAAGGDQKALECGRCCSADELPGCFRKCRQELPSQVFYIAEAAAPEFGLVGHCPLCFLWSCEFWRHAHACANQLLIGI